MAILTRSGKGQALTHAELDNNFVELRDKPDGQVYPKDANIGIKIDTAAPDWGWHDLLGEIYYEEGAPETAPFVTYQGNIKQRLWDVGDAAQVSFHVPHDYAEGTDIFIHAHWSHNSQLVTTGDVTWQAEVMYSKGHNQAFFSTPILVNMSEAASTIRYQHMVTESQLSAALGAGGLLPTEDIEIDGLLILRLTLNGNSMDGSAKPFLHNLDVHYQSTQVPTKNKSPDFYV